MLVMARGRKGGLGLCLGGFTVLGGGQRATSGRESAREDEARQNQNQMGGWGQSTLYTDSSINRVPGLAGSSR